MPTFASSLRDNPPSHSQAVQDYLGVRIGARRVQGLAGTAEGRRFIQCAQPFRLEMAGMHGKYQLLDNSEAIKDVRDRQRDLADSLWQGTPKQYLRNSQLHYGRPTRQSDTPSESLT